MAADKRTLGQSYYEDVEALKAGGMSNADAVRQVAATYDKSANTVRAGIHQYKSQHVTGAPARRGRRVAPVTVEGATAEARAIFERALQHVEEAPALAKRQLAEAQAHADAVIAATEAQRSELLAKIKALSD